MTLCAVLEFDDLLSIRIYVGLVIVSFLDGFEGSY
jgi:hypothetical protein